MAASSVTVAPGLPHPRPIGAARASVRWLLAHAARLSLATRFLLLNLLVVVTGVAVIGAWVGQEIESSVLDRTGSVVALFVDSIVSPHLQSLASGGQLSASDAWSLSALTHQPLLQQNVVAFKVWSPDGQVLFCPDPRVQGQRFPIDPGLARALQGQVSAEMSYLDEPENVFERERWSQLLEVYAPVRDNASGQIIAVTEFYQLPNDLDARINTARLQSWAVVAVIGLLTYLALAGVVKQGSDTIVRQEAALREKVAQLSGLLNQNARLHERVRQAAARTTTLNEQSLRRVSADLHDGPGQALALALLRLDTLRGHPGCGTCAERERDFETVGASIRAALAETRTISAGLRLPELGPLAVREVVDRVVAQHERQSGVAITLTADQLPEEAPLAVKIALHRGLQEALSNATRHGQGRDVRVSVWAADERLHLAVQDAGPGFQPDRPVADGHLGLAGIRERAELLEGHLEVRSAPGQGARLHVWWPLADREDA